jgi:peptide/nickel transport system ATP-binding protein
MALLEVKDLKKHFNTSKGTLHAVDGVTFSLEPGKTMGIVGESGCGKSTLGRLTIHLLESTDGNIIFEGADVTRLSGAGLKKLRSKARIIFQDPYSSLDPRMTIEDTLKEPFIVSGTFTKAEILQETERVMDLVGIDRRLRTSYPHELDGGRRQRVGIGRALALNPKYIVCDEPVSSLDVSIQAQILNLLMDLQEQIGIAYLFVTHDLSVVRHISQKICVMYLGQIVESANTSEIFEAPRHPYTQALMSAAPSVDIDHPKHQVLLHGEPTSPIDPEPGCRFLARCPYS